MQHLQIKMRQNVVFYVSAVLLALAVKYHYSRADPADLAWILKPTAGLVSLISGNAFEFAGGSGYVCPGRGVVIAPACAGVNFMLMAFGMAVFAGLPAMRGRRHGLAWICFSLAAAYCLTLGVNTLRILVSMQTLATGLSGTDSLWEQVHRLEGVGIYFFFQYLFYSMIIQITGQYAAAGPVGLSRSAAAPVGRGVGRKILVRGLVPCAWYLAVTLGVPFLNRAAGKFGSRFFEHAAMVLGLCLTTWLCLAMIEWCGRGLSRILHRRFANP